MINYKSIIIIRRNVLKALNSIVLSGKEVLPLIEGGKGISISNGFSSGAWAKCGGVGTFSGTNADSFDEEGNIIDQVYYHKTRKERHAELIAYAIRGAISQSKIAYETSGKEGRIHMNTLWEIGGGEYIIKNVLEACQGLIHGVTCGAGMPYRVAQIASHYKIFYYPIISSARAFRALWLRAYHKFREYLGAVVYEDPWVAGGHNGLSNSEDPLHPQEPYPRVMALRKIMNDYQLSTVPIVMAGGVWYLREWSNWIDNPELGPIVFQLGTRPLLTQESPIPDSWKKKLTTLREKEIVLNKFSPTGFYSSAVSNGFLQELTQRNTRQVDFSVQPISDHQVEFPIGPRKRIVYLTPNNAQRCQEWIDQGYSMALKTPDQTLIFVTFEKAKGILRDQRECMGCLSACLFSNWSQNKEGTTGRKADPRSYCIQKTLQKIIHSDDCEQQLMFAGYNAYRFATDPFYTNGFIPTVGKLIDRLLTGD